MKRIILIIALSILIPVTAQSQSLVVMAWDGAGWNNVGPLLEAGRLPNLEWLINQTGRYPSPIDLHGKTDTKNSWTRVWTGYDYDVTGTIHNYQWAIVPYGKTVIKSIQAQGIKIGWFVSKGEHVGGNGKGPLARIWNNADDNYMRHPFRGSDSYLFRLRAKTVKFISNNSNFLVFLHLNPDAYGHKHGENGKRYLHEMERADQILGDILAILPANTPIIIMSDHGFDEGAYSHSNAGDAWLWTDLPVSQNYEFQAGHHARANMKDIGTTILDWFGINWQNRVPLMRGRTLL